MLSTLKSKALALLCALAMCSGLVCLAFSCPPRIHASEAEDDAIAQYVDGKIQSALLAKGAAWLAGKAGGKALGYVIGVQLGMLIVSQNVIHGTPVSWNASNFRYRTGFYKHNGNTYSLTVAFPDDASDWYPADGGLTFAVSTEGWCCKLNGHVESIIAARSDDFRTYFQASNTNNSQMWVDCRNFDGTTPNIFSTSSFSSDGGTFYCYQRCDNYSIPVINDNNSLRTYFPSSAYAGTEVYGVTDGSFWYSMPSGSTDLVTYYNDTILPALQDNPLVIQDPELLLFPEGIEEMPEPTEPPTEAPSGDSQPFTLPPEWLETYPVPTVPDPSIPRPSDAEPPTINYEIQRYGLNFWADLWTELIDKTGLGSYVVILLGLSILEWLLWHAGNGGNGKGGEQ